MGTQIIKGDILQAQGGAIILTVDGSHRGAEGNLVRNFERKFPDAWEELDFEIEYPIPLGSSRMYKIRPDYCCPFSHAIISSTLHHIEVLSIREKTSVTGSALRSALLLAKSKCIRKVHALVLSGGWRLDFADAFDEMISSHRAMSLHYRMCTGAEYTFAR